MAREIDTDCFDATDYQVFAENVARQLDLLQATLAVPAFGQGPATIGAELELSIIGPDARALAVNRELVARHNDPRLTLELDRFNLEYNISPVPALGRPFTAIEAQLNDVVGALNRSAAHLNARVVAIGILPTLTAHDLTRAAITDAPRYHALNDGLRRTREAPFEIRIDGEDPLTIASPDISLEGANAAFQLHLRVSPDDFADTYNAAQLATPIALAIAANSPIFLGHQLWDETRVALFKQSLDDRHFEATRWRPPARVGFGHGWVRQGAYELFAESVALFPPILPACTKDTEPAQNGGPPLLRELRLHQGTVWRWNRAVYDHSDGGHLRIEMRALPSGPTPLDMTANAAFLLGLSAGLRPRIRSLLNGIPFALAEWSFYRAAQDGLDARVLWPSTHSPSPTERDVSTLALELIPIAAEGLESLGVDATEATRLLRVIRERIGTRQTGARWMRGALDRARRRHATPEALAAVVEGYVLRAAAGAPVHTWPPL